MPETHPAGNFSIELPENNSRVGYLIDYKKELADFQGCA
jgi:hypothetical protein